MCFGGGSKSSTEAPPPSQPTTFSYGQPPTQAQKAHDAAIKTAQSDTVNSTTQSQTFGAELGGGQQGAM